MSFRLLPKDVQFFDLFVADGENLREAAARAPRTGRRVRPARGADHRDPAPREARRRDRPEIGQKLEDAFVTPFDREDIHELTVRLDDVVDGIQAAAETFVIYAIEQPTDEARELTRILADQVGGAAGGPAQARRSQGPGPAPRARSTTWSTRPTPCRGRRSAACSASRRTPSRSSSGATCTASSRTPSTRPRMPPRPSSGCTTRPHRRAVRPGIRRRASSRAPASGWRRPDRTGTASVARPWKLSRPNEAASARRDRSGARWSRTSATWRSNPGSDQADGRATGSAERRSRRRASSASARAGAGTRVRGNVPAEGRSSSDGGARCRSSVRRRRARS